MEIYQNRGGDSGVRAYEIGDDYIIVQFRDSSRYLYNHASTGQDSVEHMKTLAINGHGLNSYISSVIRKRYARRL
jgi:hypothetical protein